MRGKRRRQREVKVQRETAGKVLDAVERFDDLSVVDLREGFRPLFKSWRDERRSEILEILT